MSKDYLNKISLWQNKNKKPDNNQPDYTGNIKVKFKKPVEEGTFDISVWVAKNRQEMQPIMSGEIKVEPFNKDKQKEQVPF